jgi:hypothetical protein
VPSHDLSAIVDPPRIGPGGAGEVDRRERGTAPQKAVRSIRRTWHDCAKTSHNLAATINPKDVGEKRAGRIDCDGRVAISVQQKAMPFIRILARKTKLAHDVATRIDSRRNGEVCIRKIYWGELAKPVSQKAVGWTGRSGVEAPYNFASGINTESIGGMRTGEIDLNKGYICCLTLRAIISILGKHYGRHAEQTAHQAHHRD